MAIVTLISSCWFCRSPLPLFVYIWGLKMADNFREYPQRSCVSYRQTKYLVNSALRRWVLITGRHLLCFWHILSFSLASSFCHPLLSLHSFFSRLIWTVRLCFSRRCNFWKTPAHRPIFKSRFLLPWPQFKMDGSQPQPTLHSKLFQRESYPWQPVLTYCFQYGLDAW